MAYICKFNHKCEECSHYRFDEDAQMNSCWAKYDEDHHPGMPDKITDKKMKIYWLQDVVDGKYDSLFYGGRMVEIELDKDNSLLISASGDVNALLFDDNDNVIEEVRDKNNLGRFMYEMTSVNQDNIYDLMDSNKLEIRDNNWWEINGLYKGKFVEFELLTNVLDSCRIDDAIDEVLSNLEFWKKELAEKKIRYNMEEK